jgi:hypothetical protein
MTTHPYFLLHCSIWVKSDTGDLRVMPLCTRKFRENGHKEDYTLS